MKSECIPFWNILQTTKKNIKLSFTILMLLSQMEFTMEKLAESVNKFLDFNNFKVLEWNWKISKKQAEEKAYNEYDEFNKTQKIISDFDKLIGLNK